MAKCDEGYRCEVCGNDVEAVTDSDLYLRFVLGEVLLEMLHRLPERHLRCNPALAQYIIHPAFKAVVCEGPFAKSGMNPEFVCAEEKRVTRGTGGCWDSHTGAQCAGVPAERNGRLRRIVFWKHCGVGCL